MFHVTKEKTPELRRGIRNKAFYFLFGFISNGFDADHVPGFSGALVYKFRCFGGSIPLWQPLQKFRRDKDAVGAVKRRHQDDARLLGLIAEPSAGSSEDEQQNKRDNNVVLPASPGKIPENQTFSQAAICCATQLLTYRYLLQFIICA